MKNGFILIQSNVTNIYTLNVANIISGNSFLISTFKASVWVDVISFKSGLPWNPTGVPHELNVDPPHVLLFASHEKKNSKYASAVYITTLHWFKMEIYVLGIVPLIFAKIEFKCRLPLLVVWCPTLRADGSFYRKRLFVEEILISRTENSYMKVG